jgi:NAD(P)-dependent dehydrogenase (short-subunit alcohol dehydrogenase family)
MDKLNGKVARLEGKVAVVTGGGRGIGRAVATLFAQEGARVVVGEISEEGGLETVRLIEKEGGVANYVHTNVSQTEDVKKMVSKAIEMFGKLDILVNNAGIVGEIGSTDKCTEENWENVININLKGIWLGMKYAIPHMLKNGSGSIVNIASQAGERGVPNIPAYSASKGGILALSRATAMEFAKQNIRVNCINPGIIATPLQAAMPEESKKSYLPGIPQGRYGKPEEVARAALFLASDESSHTTGHALLVDGGMENDSHVSM